MTYPDIAAAVKVRAVAVPGGEPHQQGAYYMWLWVVPAGSDFGASGNFDGQVEGSTVGVAAHANLGRVKLRVVVALDFSHPVHSMD